MITLLRIPRVGKYSEHRVTGIDKRSGEICKTVPSMLQTYTKIWVPTGISQSWFPPQHTFGPAERTTRYNSYHWTAFHFWVCCTKALPTWVVPSLSVRWWKTHEPGKFPVISSTWAPPTLLMEAQTPGVTAPLCPTGTGTRPPAPSHPSAAGTAGQVDLHPRSNC